MNLKLLMITALFGGMASGMAIGQTPDEKPIFNGKDLKGWDVAGEIEAVVEGGAIVLRTKPGSDGGWLVNRNSYGNFELSIDFRLQPNSSSGVAFRYDDRLVGDPALTGYVVNLDHDQDQQNPTGSLYNVARAQWLNSLNLEGWKNLRITAHKDHLQIHINDTLVSETHSRRAINGKIALQGPVSNGSAEVRFKNLRLEPRPSTVYLGPQVEDYLRSSEAPLRSLFDGRTLTQWHPKGNGTWEVREGAIYGQAGSENAWLVSDSLYQNFYLRLKFKIAKEENSGVFIRTDPGAGNIGTETGLECNIYDHNGFGHAYSTGSIVTHARAWSNLVDYDDWNNMEIFALNDQVTLYVNGTKSSERHFEQGWNRPGTICFQAGPRVFTDNGASEVWFKDIEIKNID